MCIAESVRDEGTIKLLADESRADRFYAYHPPFYFWLVGGLGRVFQHVDTIALARGVNAVAFQLAMLVLLIAIVRGAQLPFPIAFGAVALVQIDLWTLQSTRIGWFENVQFLPVIGMQAALLVLLRTGGYRAGIAAGLLGGAAVVFKHIGAWVFIEAALLLLLFPSRRHALLATIGSMLLVVTVYLVWQLGRGGEQFVEQTLHQLARASGEKRSHGVNFSLAEAVRIFTDAYAVFWPSLLVTGVAALAAVAVTVRIARRTLGGRERDVLARSQDCLLVVLAAWLLAACVGLALIRLRNPHYYFIVFVPACAFLGTALALAVGRGGGRALASGVLAAVLVVGNSIGFRDRLDFDDGVLGRYRDGAGRALAGKTVLTEEPLACLTREIGAYRDVRLSRNRDPALLTDGTLDAVVLLSSRAYAPPLSDAWRATLVAHWSLVAEDADWKWRLEVWRPR